MRDEVAVMQEELIALQPQLVKKNGEVGEMKVSESVIALRATLSGRRDRSPANFGC